MSDQNFCIAHLSEKEQQAIHQAEANFKSATGKDCVLIAWEKK